MGSTVTMEHVLEAIRNHALELYPEIEVIDPSDRKPVTLPEEAIVYPAELAAAIMVLFEKEILK